MKNKYLIILFYFIGVYFSSIVIINNFYNKNYTNDDSYSRNPAFYLGSKSPDLILYAIKNETFKKSNTDIKPLFNFIDANYPNYNIINIIKLYNSILLLNKKEISSEAFLQQIKTTEKFHRYSESYTHIAMQTYAHNGDLDQFSKVLTDIFYRNIKYALPFNLKRENIKLNVVKFNESGIGVDISRRAVLVQLSVQNANYILNNSVEKYGCRDAQNFITENLISNFKFFYSEEIPVRNQKLLLEKIDKTFVDLISLCHPRVFVFE